MVEPMQVDNSQEFASYVFGPRGDLYSLDEGCIVMEGSAFEVLARKLDHSKLWTFGVQSVIESPSHISPEMVVVVNTDQGADNYWFVRINCYEYGGRADGFGIDFLWQLPEDWCRNIIDRMAKSPVTARSIELTSVMFPTASTFDPDIHSAVCKKNPRIHTVISKAFFMFTRPASVKPVPVSRNTSCARPDAIRGQGSFDITQLDDDTSLMILETCVGSLLRGSKKAACKHLLSLRSVCRLFKDTVDIATTLYTEDIFRMIQSSLTSSCTMQMQCARNRISDLECNMFDKIFYHKKVNSMTFYSLFMEQQHSAKEDLDGGGPRKLRRITA
jgi:hypothetical protein